MQAEIAKGRKGMNDAFSKITSMPMSEEMKAKFIADAKRNLAALEKMMTTN